MRAREMAVILTTPIIFMERIMNKAIRNLLWPIFVFTLSLSACGVEVATTAATVGAAKAEEAKQAKEQLRQVEETLAEAQRLQETRAQASEEATRAASGNGD
jgi:hypothetical protein